MQRVEPRRRQRPLAPRGLLIPAIDQPQLLKRHKFDVDRSAKDTDHDLWFSGSVQNTDSQIIEHFDQNRHLVATNVNLLTSDEDCKSMFDSVVSGLTKKYGDPSSKKAIFQLPYTGTPSDFIPAIKHNKANFDVTWNQASDYDAGIEARVDDDLTVLIFYKSPQGEIERLRSNSKLDPNL
jgi:hypothetical protein